MTLGDAVPAVEATPDSLHLRVDRRRAREDATSYLLIVLDVGGGRGEGPVAHGPRLVDKHSGAAPWRVPPRAREWRGKGSFR